MQAFILLFLFIFYSAIDYLFENNLKILGMRGIILDARVIEKAIREALDKAGTQTNLAEKTGISQGNLNNILNGKISVDKMTVGTLLKLFPEMEISFFRDQRIPVAQPNFPPPDSIDRKIFDFISRLTPDEKLDCLMFISAKFRDKLIKPGE